MIYNYFKSAFRHFLRSKYFSILNITSLAVGFSTTLLLALFIWQESSYDNFHEKTDRIVRVTMEYKYDGQKAEAAVTGALVASAFSQELPEVVKAVRFAKSPVVARYGDHLYEEDRFLYADSTFFDIFSFTLQRGNPKKALQGPYKVVLTESAALQYFGESDPVGKSLLINNNREYMVTGIIEDAPANSQIQYDFVASFASLNAYKNEAWFNANYYTYLLLNSPESIGQLQAKLFDYMKTKMKDSEVSGDNYLTYNLEPLQDVHVYSKLSGLEPNIDARYIYIFSIVALLILIIACINYMNLATARAAERGIEVGIRKVLGAQKNQLFWQFINEAIINVGIAALLGWAITSLTLPLFNQLLSKSYTMDLLINRDVFLIIGGVLIIVAFGAGAYPSLVLSRFNPSKTLKGAFKTSTAGVNLRRALIVFQFTISTALIIASLVIYKQLSYIQTTNLGYQKEHIIVQKIDSRVVDKFEAFRASLAQFPQIEEITMAYETPTSIEWGDGIGTANNTNVMTAASPVEINYINTLNIELVAGKNFSLADQQKAYSDSAYYLHQKERSILINEKAAEALGWSPATAIGKHVDFKGNATIIGVIKDFHFAPMHEEIGPLVLFVDKMYNSMLIRVKGDDIPSTLNLLADQWKEIAPHIPFDPYFMDQEYNAMYLNEQQLGGLSLFFTIITVILSGLGLIGLSALMIGQRVKEIGIRKVLGASIPQLIHVLTRDFIKLAAIAFTFAVPLSWYALNNWLQSFTYKIEMPYLIFIFSGGILFSLILLILCAQTIKAALRNPVEVLKYE